MRNLDIFELSSDEAKATTKQHLSKCLEGFEIEAEYNCRLAIVKAFVDYSVDVKRLSMSETRVAVNDAVSKMVEKYNCGTTKLIEDVNQLVYSKFKPKRALEQLAMSITKSFRSINTKYTVPPIRVAIESLGAEAPTGDQVPDAVTLGLVYFEKYGTRAVESCFSADFNKYLLG